MMENILNKMNDRIKEIYSEVREEGSTCSNCKHHVIDWDEYYDNSYCNLKGNCQFEWDRPSSIDSAVSYEIKYDEKFNELVSELIQCTLKENLEEDIFKLLPRYLKNIKISNN